MDTHNYSVRLSFDNQTTLRVDLVARDREQAIRRALASLHNTAAKHHVDALMVWETDNERPSITLTTDDEGSARR